MIDFARRLTRPADGLAPVRRLLAAIALLVSCGGAWAGGGPENVLVVVDANHAGSLAVANHYVHLRDIPASNVVYLDYKGPRETTPVERFREEILRPVLEAIDERRLGLQIDMVAYSVGFPWRVTLGKDYPKELKLPPQAKPIASLTGATYFWQQVMAKSPGLLSLDANAYVAPTPPGKARSWNAAKCRDLGECPSRTFRSRYAWLPDGSRSNDPKQGRRYLMATMLGVTSGRGNTLEEVIAALDRAVEAEASPPSGTVYFMRNNNVRSKTRHACFQSVVEAIRAIGGNAATRPGVTPKGAADVAGLVMGAAELDLEGIAIQPGAICEHLTSTGGVLFRKGHQTALSELIRAGATGASGTVTEPYAIQAKFPLPSLQLHYRRGCSLAESFYQSVASPYQLLIVGDPLCQPWANRPTLAIEGWPTGMPFELDYSGLGIAGLKAPDKPSDTEPEAGVKITPTVNSAGAAGQTYWELFVDGRLQMRLPSGRGVALGAERLGLGWRELRCVGFSADPIESQRHQLGSIELLARGEVTIQPVRITADPVAASDGQLRVSASAPGAERIVIRQNSREVAAIDGAQGEAVVPGELLGVGPTRLQAIAEPISAASPPVWVRVE